MLFCFFVFSVFFWVVNGLVVVVVGVVFKLVF